MLLTISRMRLAMSPREGGMPKAEFEIIIILGQKTQGGSIGQNRTTNSLALSFKELILLIENLYSPKISLEINHQKNRERFEYYYGINIDYDDSLEELIEKLLNNLLVYLCRNIEIAQKRSSMNLDFAFEEFISFLSGIDGERIGEKTLELLRNNQNKIRNIVVGVANRYSIQILRGKMSRGKVFFPAEGEGRDGLFGGGEGPGFGNGAPTAPVAVETGSPKPSPPPGFGGNTPRPLVIGVLNSLDFSSVNKSKIKINNGQKVIVVSFSEESFAKICRIVGDSPRGNMQFSLEKDRFSQDFFVQDVTVV